MKATCPSCHHAIDFSKGKSSGNLDTCSCAIIVCPRPLCSSILMGTITPEKTIPDIHAITLDELFSKLSIDCANSVAILAMKAAQRRIDAIKLEEEQHLTSE